MALEEQVVEKLIEKNLHISFAESCTGGMCCGTIINVANASKVLDVSFVTYANEAKIEFLGVKADTILSNGVVSEEVACGMAPGGANYAGFGADSRTRTDDLIITNDLLYQLSHISELLNFVKHFKKLCHHKFHA